jgi:outer membrane protein
MKNISLILNGVLLAAVVALYVLFFIDKKDDVTEETGTKIDLPEVQGGIVYVDIDSVINRYDMYFDIQEELQKKLKTSEAQFNSKQNALRKEFEDFQYKVERGLLTRSEAEQLQQQLARKEQELYQLQQQLQYQLAEEEQVAQRKVINAIMVYLEGMEEAKDYQFILGATFGGNILYANDQLNVTKKVIEGLNTTYRAENEED